MTDEPAALPAPGDNVDVELATVPDEFGTIVVGSEDELEEFAQRWDGANQGGVVKLSPAEISKLIGAAPELMNAAKSARFVLGSSLWRTTGTPKPGTVVTYHRMTRSAASGKILANPRVAIPPTVGAAAFPPAAVALVGVQLALSQMSEQINARLDVIKDKVDAVLNLASAQLLGDVYGHQRLLKRKLEEIDDGSALTDTDWSSIASLGTDLEVGVERLRQHAVRTLLTMNANDDADKRAEHLKKAVTDGRLCETLQLLLVAQQSLYMWQRLRLERVSTAEPDFIGQTTASARTTLREQLGADRELADKLRRTIDSYAFLRVSEVHRQLSGRTLTKYRAPLAEMVDKFIEIRGLQVDSWIGTRHATVREAVDAAASNVAQVTRRGRKQLADWIAPKEDPENKD